MGVPAFYRQWLKNAGFRGVLLNQYPLDIVSMSIDMNGLIHRAASIVYNYGDNADTTQKRRGKKDSLLADFYLTFFNLLSNVVNVTPQGLRTIVKPQEVLVLAIDGVAPVAKIQQQRQRRYRNAKEKKSGPLFDSNAITPGTELMQSLDEKIVKHLEDNSLSYPKKVIYSGWNVPGEGEHKILAYMRSGEIPQGEGNHIIYGLDADLIMLALVSPLNRIFLVREDVRDVISIDALREGLRERMKTPSAIEDFVLMMFLLGNDFLPKMFAFSEMSRSIDTMMEVYINLGIPLTKKQNNSDLYNQEIDFNNLRSFLSALVPIEKEFIELMSTKVYTYPSDALNHATTVTYFPNRPPQYQFEMNKFRNFWYMEALGTQIEINTQDNKDALDALEEINDNQPVFTPTLERVKQMNLNYLNGLAWAFSYYMEGDQRINPQYLYLYYSAPLIHDLSRINAIPNHWCQKSEGFNVIQQLLSVIPPSSKKLIPRKWHYFYDPTSPIYDTFIEDFKIYREAVDKDWLGHSLLPPIEPERIIEATQDLNLKRNPQYLNQAYYVMIREDVPVSSFRGRGSRGSSSRGSIPRGSSSRGSSSRGSSSRGSSSRGSSSRGFIPRGSSSRGSSSRGSSSRGSIPRGTTPSRGYTSSRGRVPRSPIRQETYQERMMRSENKEWSKTPSLI